MNKIFASIGAVALGTTAVQAAGGVEMVDPTKPWSVSASLRGFYDDNYVTAPKGAERDSYGIEVRPSAALYFPLEQTTLGLRYTLGAKWYQDREDLSSSNDPWDFSHELDAFLNHQFSQRYLLDVRDSFVITQEPELLSGNGPVTSPFRTESDNMRNLAEANFTAVLTRELSLVLGYQNTWVDYDSSGPVDDGVGNISASLSGRLDRMQHLGLINLRWQARKDSVVVFGYNYGQVGYLSDEKIAYLGTFPTGQYVNSDYRDNTSHYGYVGLDQTVSKDLMFTLRGGVQAIDYVNDPQSDSELSPYGQVSLTYKYLPDSQFSVGWTYSHSATDIVAPSATGQITQDQESSYLFASINHHLSPFLTGYVNGFWQNSSFNGGAFDGEIDNFYGVGFGLRYRFNQNLSGDLGYSFDTLASDVPNRGEYDRNRVHIGVTATY